MNGRVTGWCLLSSQQGKGGTRNVRKLHRKARRSIFFARQQASELGSREINSDCLLLGVLQENGHIAERWLGMTPNEVRDAIVRSALSTIEKAATNVDMALTPEAMRVLGHASEEVDPMGHRHIGTEHLLLGLLREHETFAQRRLNERGIALEKVRVDLAEDAVKNAPVWEPEMVKGMRMLLVLEDGTSWPP
jgi:ATP-dependent Clp protease ATP-binding subunit ClpC